MPLSVLRLPPLPAAAGKQHWGNLPGAALSLAIAEAATKKRPVVRHGQKVGRNDPCPCGSGRKYKHCHGKLS